MHFIRVAIACLIVFLFHHAWAIAQEKTSRIEPAISAGDTACTPCHKNEVLSYSKTAHHLTSQLADKSSVLGSLENGSNILMITNPETAGENPGLYFKMEARDSGFFQTAIFGWPGHFRERTARMDIVIGSGVRGQSYLSWQGDELYELPVSYWSDGHRWMNSPGYKDGTMDFSRPVVPRCLECHSTFIRALSTTPLGNRYDKASLVVGITCEKCHGSGAAHIALESAKQTRPNPPTNVSILNPAAFPRDRQVDLCALCHNGIRDEEFSPAFSFTPGEQLDKYLQPNAKETVETPSVHGNQVGLLKKSKCYLSSPTMSCSTCHDVHAPEMAPAAYSRRCLTCHRAESCGKYKTMGTKVADDCIDCHMPVQSTSAVVSQTAGEMIRPKMRNHWIKIYN